jgi:hypothetical protein
LKRQPGAATVGSVTDPEPSEGWELLVSAANIARLARDLRRLELRVTVVEVKLAIYATLGGAIGGVVGALVVALIARD